MKLHTVFGNDALKITEQKLGQSHFLHYAREIAYTHQEKWDGSGYPQGLKGKEIPISGRLMALADVYDALISKRVYKPPFPHEKAVAIITESKGSHFDPDVVDVFLELEGTFRNIALTFADHDEEREVLGGKAGDAFSESELPPIRKILLVEDNEINLQIMQSQLVAMGYVVETAANGRDAWEKYQAGGHDAVLTDIEMPEMDGYTLVKYIRSAESESERSVPVLAITASDFELNDEQANSLGFDGFMLKPLDEKILQTKLGLIY